MGKEKRRKLNSLRKAKQVAYARPENAYAHQTVASLSARFSASLDKELNYVERQFNHALKARPESARKLSQQCKRLADLKALWLSIQLEQENYLAAIKTRMLLEARQAPKVNMHWGSLTGLVTTPHQAHVTSTHPLHKTD